MIVAQFAYRCHRKAVVDLENIETASNTSSVKDKKVLVKVQVKKKTDFESFEKYVDQINFNNPYEMKIIESFEEYNSDNVGEMIELADTSDLIAEYIDDVATDNNKEQITQLMLSIYEEAKNIDDHI